MMPELASSTTNPAGELKHLCWTNLPVLSFGSVLVAVGWVLVRLWSPQLGWTSLVLIGVLVMPAQATLVRACEVLLTGDHFGMSDLVATLVRSFRSTVVVLILPEAALILTLAALDLWRVTGQPWMLVSIGVGTAFSAATVFIGVVTLPYVTRTRTRVGDSWLTGCYIASRCPVPVLAVLSAITLAVLGAAYLSFALIILLPAPLALIWASAVTGATRRCQERLPGWAAGETSGRTTSLNHRCRRLGKEE